MRFWKLQALGNDFLIVERAEVADAADLGALARRLCDRHYGAGADGMVLVTPFGDGAADVASRIFNADGGEAEVSGNGTRCVAAWVDATGRWPAGRDDLRVATAAGTKRVRLVERGERAWLFEMDMGSPRFAPAEVPMRLDEELDRVVAHPLEVEGATHRVTALSVGNPHCSLLVDDLEAVDVRALGPAIEHHAAFPERTNVEFVEPVAADRVRVHFWERGVGETLSSGTGASAAAVAAVVAGRVTSPVTVETAAGALRVAWGGPEEPVLVTGPVETVFEGRWLAPRRT
jgi:diaminopimelate epimerase